MTEKHTPLLPCPFCGGTATMEQTVDNRWSVGCDSADEPACMGYQSFTTFDRRSAAGNAWNTRPVNALPDLVAALKRILDITQSVSIEQTRAFEEARAALAKVKLP